MGDHTVTEPVDMERFLDDLERELHDRRLTMLDSEFLAAAEAGELSRDQIETWAKDFYAATRNGRLSIGNFYANSPDDPELRADLAENLYEEETGRISGVGRCHMDVFHDLLTALGVPDDVVSGLGSSDQALARVIPREDFYVELAAYGFSVEVPNAEFCVRIHKALNENYGLGDEALTWFSMHAELDEGHGDEFRKYAHRVADQPDGPARLREATLGLSTMVKEVWNGFGHWQRSEAASSARKARS